MGFTMTGRPGAPTHPSREEAAPWPRLTLNSYGGKGLGDDEKFVRPW